MGSYLQTTQGSASETPDRVLVYSASFEVPNHYSKKNSKSLGWRKSGSSKGYSPFIRTNSKYAAAEKLLVRSLSGGVFHGDMSYPIDIPVHAVFVLELERFYTKKGTISLTAGDLENLISGPLDALQKANIIANDALVTDITASKKAGPKNKISIWLYC